MKDEASIRRVSPAEAKRLLDEGYTYVDVRRVDEFVTRHPVGAVNAPFELLGAAGPHENPEFLTLMTRAFAPDAKIVVGCATGVRSLRAAKALVRAGFTDIIDQRAGLLGVRSPFGALTEPGWVGAGLPVATGDDAGSYDALRVRSLG
jgi:rhodanese-related sulfurtransferase